MIDRDTIDRIFAAAEIVDIVGEFVQLQRKGVNYTACCPFHNEKTPSFIVSPAKGLYKCFGCAKGGNAINFVMEHEKLSYPDALKWVARKYGIPIQETELSEDQVKANDDKESMMIVTAWAAEYFEKQLSVDEGEKIAKPYFYERGFSDATIKKFGLGYCPSRGDMTKQALSEGYKEEFLLKTGLSAKRDDSDTAYDKFRERVIFPIHSVSGRVIGFGGRTMRSDKKVAKYLNSPESEIYHKSYTLYGIFFAKKSIVAADKCILVEGYTDVIQMHQSGIENVVASSGTSLTVDQVKLIKRFAKNVTVIYDGDSAGIKASLRGIDMLLKEGLSVRIVPLPEGDDPDSFAKSHSASQIEQYIEENEQDFISFKIKILLEGAENDPIKRAEVISDVIKSIAVIPDAVVRSVYIRECARTLEVDESMLQNEVRRGIARFTDGQIGRQAVDNQIKKENFQNRAQNGYQSGAQRTLQGGHDGPPDEPFFEVQKKGPNRVDASLEALEKEIVGYIIKFGNKEFDYVISPTDVVAMNVTDAILDELEADNVKMINPIYQQIIDECTVLRDQQKEITPNFFINHENQTISALSVDFFTSEELYKPSKMWEKHEIKIYSEEEMLGEAVPKAIIVYKSKVMEWQIGQLQKELDDPATEPERMFEILQTIAQKNTTRSVILQRCQRLF